MFRGASADGSRTVFISPRQLVNSDVDATADLYVYDFGASSPSERLVQLSLGDAAARVQGVVRISDDGSRVYFVAQGVLNASQNAEGASAINGQNNLYVWRRAGHGGQGATSFIATLQPGSTDASMWSAGDDRQVHAVPRTGTAGDGAQGGGDGRVLVFQSAAKLTEDVPSAGTVNIFRYDDVSGSMTLISRGDPGLGAQTAPSALTRVAQSTGSRQPYAGNGRSVSENGRVIAFTTSRPLMAEDQNGVPDVYEWRSEGDPDDGQLRLVTDGVFVPDALQPASAFKSMTPDGNSLLIYTSQGLVAEDKDDKTDVYVARIGGGGFRVPPVEPPADPCGGDGCQGPNTAAPKLPSIGSEGFLGRGNLSASPALPQLSIGARNQAIAGATGKLRVRVSRPGRISVAGPLLRPTRISASAAGTYSVKLILSKRGRKALKKQKRLKAGVYVAYRTRDGRSASRRISVTFRQSAARRSQVKGGGR